MITPQHILLATALVYQVTPHEILSRTRTQHLANARHTAIALTRHLTTLSLQEIGHYFDNRDHSSIRHNCKAHHKLINKPTHANHTHTIRATLANLPSNLQNLCPHPQIATKFPNSPEFHFSASLTP